MDGKLRNMTSVYLHDDNNRMLLLYRIGSKVINDSYTGTAGGHFEKEELNDAKKCVLRELNEETGLTIKDISNLELRYITLKYKNGEIRQNYYFFAKLNDKNREVKSMEGKLKWFSYDEMSTLEMPFTAKYVVEHYIRKGKNNHKLYGGIASEYGINFIELKDF